jgi:hypothetical protein
MMDEFDRRQKLIIQMEKDAEAAELDKLFKCTKCNKVFKHKSKLQSHLSRKTSCSPVIEISGEKFELAKKDKRLCLFCNRIFASRQSLKTHITKNCPIAPTGKNGSVGMEILSEHLSESNLSNKQSSNHSDKQPDIDKSHDTQSDESEHVVSASSIVNNSNITNNTNSNNTNSNNITNNITNNNITINMCGNENLKYITREDIFRFYEELISNKVSELIEKDDKPTIAKVANNIIRQSLEAVYNDKYHPENFNVFIPTIKKFSDAKNLEIMVFKNGGWVFEDCEKVYETITDTVIYKLLGDYNKIPDGAEYRKVMRRIARTDKILVSMITPVIARIRSLLESYNMLPSGV